MKQAVRKEEQRLLTAADNASERIKRYNDEVDAKIGALEEQAKKVRADVKSRIDERIAEIPRRPEAASRQARAGMGAYKESAAAIVSISAFQHCGT